MKPNLYFQKVLLPTTLAGIMIVCLFSCNKIQEAVAENKFSKQLKEGVEADYYREKDNQFLINAAEISLEEIEIGQLALRSAMVLEVRELGKMISDDHRIAFEGLKKLADQKQVKIPLSLTNDSQVIYEKLSVEATYEFDQKYCDMMVSGHKRTIGAFEKRIRETQDSEIKIWAQQALPGLKKHLEEATICQKDLEPTVMIH